MNILVTANATLRQISAFGFRLCYVTNIFAFLACKCYFMRVLGLHIHGHQLHNKYPFICLWHLLILSLGIYGWCKSTGASHQPSLTLVPSSWVFVVFNFWSFKNEEEQYSSLSLEANFIWLEGVFLGVFKREKQESCNQLSALHITTAVPWKSEESQAYLGMPDHWSAYPSSFSLRKHQVMSFQHLLCMDLEASGTPKANKKQDITGWASGGAAGGGAHV